MTELNQSLLDLALFADVPETLARQIVADASVREGQSGEYVDIRSVDYFVLIEGDAALVKLDTGRTMAQLRAASGDPPAWLYAVTAQHVIKLGAASRYIVLDGDHIDAAIDNAQGPGLALQLEAKTAGVDARPATSHSASAALSQSTSATPTQSTSATPAQSTSAAQAQSTPPAPASEMKQRTDWLRRSPIFAKMSLFEVAECAAALQPFEAGENWDVILQGSPGNYFYLIESGTVEVWRTDELDFDDDARPQLVATLGAGDSFGEEALLQGGARNATVRMKQAGRLWRLEKTQFDELLRSAMLHEIDADAAMKELSDGSAALIDCRYGFENEMIRLPNSLLMPLNEIRERVAELEASGDLDQSTRYLVYCRSGMRSKAAAFLMQTMGFEAKSIRGGITAWPYDTETG